MARAKKTVNSIKNFDYKQLLNKEFWYNNEKVLGKYNPIDFSIVAVIAIIIFAILCTKVGIFRPLSNIVRGNKTVEFTVVTKAYDVTAKDELFNVGSKTFITIRNNPYTSLEIVDVKKDHVQEMFFNYDRPEVPYVYPNLAYPNSYRYQITLQDKAQVTADGPVIGGNKIKIGLPVDLEGFNYRFSGFVSDVKIVEDED